MFTFQELVNYKFVQILPRSIPYNPNLIIWHMDVDLTHTAQPYKWPFLLTSNSMG